MGSASSWVARVLSLLSPARAPGDVGTPPSCSGLASVSQCGAPGLTGHLMGWVSEQKGPGPLRSHVASHASVGCHRRAVGAQDQKDTERGPRPGATNSPFPRDSLPPPLLLLVVADWGTSPGCWAQRGASLQLPGLTKAARRLAGSLGTTHLQNCPQEPCPSCPNKPPAKAAKPPGSASPGVPVHKPERLLPRSLGKTGLRGAQGSAGHRQDAGGRSALCRTGSVALGTRTHHAQLRPSTSQDQEQGEPRAAPWLSVQCWFTPAPPGGSPRFPAAEEEAGARRPQGLSQGQPGAPVARAPVPCPGPVNHLPPEKLNNSGNNRGSWRKVGAVAVCQH